MSLAAFYLSLDNVFDDEAALKKLLKCANLVRAEIASDYFPLITAETVSSVDGIISMYSLMRRPVDVKRITKGGKAVKFKVYPDIIKTVPGEAEIEYSYMPEDAGLHGDAGFSDKIGARVLACGTAAEYCLITGLFEEAALWEKRYKDSLLAAQRKKSEIRVRQRRWT